MSENLAKMAVPGLLNLYALILQELTTRGVIRSTNNPVADYAEYLVVSALGLSRASKSTKGYDAEDAEGKRYEIKSRRVTSHNISRQLSAIRDCEAAHFDFLAGVLFNEDFSFDRACLVPFSIVIADAKYRKHVNAHLFQLKDSVWDQRGVIDISDKVRAVIDADQRRFEKAQGASGSS